MLSLGDFSSQIIIQVGEQTTDSMGGVQYSWDNVTTAWAKVEFKDGKSDDDQNRITSNNYIHFTIREEGTSYHYISGQKYRIAFPISNGVAIAISTQYYTIEGIKLWGGLNKYRTFICTATQLEDKQIYIG